MVELISADDKCPAECPICQEVWYDPEYEIFDPCPHMVFEFDGTFVRATPTISRWVEQMVLEGKAEARRNRQGEVLDIRMESSELLECPHVEAIVEMTGASASSLVLQFGFSRDNTEPMVSGV